MSGERCPTCDRVECTMPALTRDYREAREAAIRLADTDGDEYEAAVHHATILYNHFDEIGKRCMANRVDWRARALAAERDRDEAVAKCDDYDAALPAPEEIEALAKELFAAARNRWIWDSRNDVTKNEWRCAAREAWRLGARTRRTP